MGRYKNYIPREFTKNFIPWDITKISSRGTLQKFHPVHSVETSRFFYHSDFYAKSILRILEVHKLNIFTHLQALKFDFYEFLHILKAEIYQMNKFHSP